MCRLMTKIITIFITNFIILLWINGCLMQRSNLGRRIDNILISAGAYVDDLILYIAMVTICEKFRMLCDLKFSYN